MEVIEWSKRIFSEKYSTLPMEQAFKNIVTKLGFDEKDAKYLIEFKFMPGGRIIYGLAEERSKVTLSNCFTIPIKKDSLNAIMEALTEASLTMKAGGGIGYNFSILRPKGSRLLSNNTISSGVISFMRLFDVACEELINGGNRRGAQIGILDVWHPGIIDFIRAKEDGSLRNFNISVGIYDIFMKCVEKDEEWHLIFPDYEKNIKLYNEKWDGNIYKWMENGYPVKTYKTIKAKELYDMIIKHNYDHAEPGMFFIDTVNKYNPLRNFEWINAVNPCGELPLSYYNACSLGSINWSSFVKNPFTDNAYFDSIEFEETIKFAVKFMDKVFDFNWFPIDKQYDEVINKRIIGLGVTGLADCLAMLKLRYNSEEGRKFAENIMKLQKRVAYKTSIELAKEKGPFRIYNADKYINTEHFMMLEEDIREGIKKYGIRNGRLLTIAPTGTTSIIQNNCSSGIEPIFALEFIKKLTIDHKKKIYEDVLVENNAWRIYKKLNPNAKIENKPDYFVTANEISVNDHILMQSVLQKYVDSSISKTINVPEDYPYNDFKAIYYTAWKNKLKGCTTYRPNPIIPPVMIEVNKKEETKESNKKIQQPIIIEKELFDVEKSVRHRVVWKDGIKMYIIVSIDEEGNPLEVFAKLPASAGQSKNNPNFDAFMYLDRISNVDCICRLVSKLLRIGYSVNEICRQLDKASFSMFDFSAVLSRILKLYPINYDTLESIEKEEFEEIKEEIKYNNSDKLNLDDSYMKECPECGCKTLFNVAGCEECLRCGYCKCS